MKTLKNKKQNKKKKLKIAVPKGRVLKDALGLLRNSGYVKHPDIDYDSRKLIFDYDDDDVSLLIVKPWDVPTFVEYGAADAGISGKDVLLENPRNVYEPLDLGIGKCRVVAAVDRDIMDREIKRDYKSDNERLLDDIKKKIYYSGSNLRIATKYVCITRDFFNKKGVSNVQIIKLYGNVELAPISGLCDFIVDLVSTGETLKQNNLMPLEDIVFVTSRLIVNRASLKINSEEIASLIDNLREQVKKNAGI
ncbi:MAG: ATP phosphoribosyltransferase [bacterium]|jgi:ATP phosphoribosyltransferase